MTIPPKSKSLPSEWIALSGKGAQPDELELGYISGVFGVRGEVRLHLFNRDSRLLHKGKKVVLLTPDSQRYEIYLRSRPGTGGRVIGHIDGLNDREFARDLKDWRFCIGRDSLPPLKPDEYLVHDVCGLPVYCGERLMGRVVSVHETDGGDLFEINDDAGAVHFVRSSKDVVSSVSVGENGRIVLLHADWERG